MVKYLIVGSGLYGSVCARELTDAGHNCFVIEKRNHIGGNCYSKYHESSGAHQHIYGPHIFHTNSKEIWDYVNQFAEFNHFVNRPKVNYKGKIYSFPLNLLTLNQIYGVQTPAEAEAKLKSLRNPIENPRNLEEWCISEIGQELYEIFIKGYTAKQWGRDPKELPASIIKRLPFRTEFNDNYFFDRYQGIPIGGYTQIFEKLLAGIKVELGVDFLKDKDDWIRKYDKIIYTGPIDAFFDYSEGVLEYRSLRFESEEHHVRDFQGNAIINFTEQSVPYTRIVEYKHFDLNLKQPTTFITREYPQKWKRGMTEFYPVNTDANQDVYNQYRMLAEHSGLPVVFGGRLGQYRYYDMHQVIASALTKVKSLLGNKYEFSSI